MMRGLHAPLRSHRGSTIRIPHLHAPLRSRLSSWVVAFALAMVGAWVSPPPVLAEEWTSLGPAPIATGPFTGRLSAVIASPTLSNLYYVAGGSGGVWRTQDAGRNWTPLTDDLPICAIGALAMDPSDENTIYAGSGEANFANHSLYGLGLYKSTDGGDTWTVLAGETFSGRTFSRILVSPADPEVLYASIMHAGGFPARNAAKGHPLTDGPVGVFRSTDGGVSWTHLSGGLPAVAASDVAMDPDDSQTLYAAIGDIFGDAQNGIYKSIDGGDTWSMLTGGLPTGIGRISLTVAPTMGQRVFALITNPSDEFGGGATTENVYRSDDGGVTWTPTNPSSNLQATYGWYLSTLIVDPDDPDTVFAGGLNLLRSTNAGDTYTNVTPPHVDMHGLAYTSNHNLLCADDGGMHRSFDNGSTWLATNEGLSVIQFYAGLSVHPDNVHFVLGGTQDNGTNRRMSDGVEWSGVLGGDGGYTALHPENPDTMFAEFQGSGNLYRSTNGGSSFLWSASGISGSDRHCFVPPFTYSPSSTDVLLYATHRIYRSTNNGSSWTPITGDLTGGSPAAVRALIYAPSNDQTVYASTNDGRVLVSTDGGFKWDQKLSDVPGWPRVTSELAVDPFDDGVAYLAVAQFGVDQVRMTIDHGDTWMAIDGDLPDVPANTVAVYRDGPKAGSTLFVGTDAGVYTSCNSGENWRKVGTNMPNTPVIDLIVDTVHGRLLAASLGRGVWTMPLPSPPDGDADGDVDMVDFGSLQDCFSGSRDEPGYVPPAQDCLVRFDFDFDDDIDLLDFMCFVDALAGPQ